MRPGSYVARMNADHHRLCGSPEWAAYLRDEVLRPLLKGAELGDEMLELGPGPGCATELLRQHVAHVTALELDEEAALKLAERFAQGDVTVVRGDCTRTELPDESFDSVGAFTMLHHIPTDRQQHAALAEVYRMLRPGGVFLGSDSLASDDLHHFHADDTYNPIEPAWLVTQLLTLGFQPITVTVGEQITFTARKPRDPQQEG